MCRNKNEPARFGTLPGRENVIRVVRFFFFFFFSIEPDGLPFVGIRFSWGGPRRRRQSSFLAAWLRVGTCRFLAGCLFVFLSRYLLIIFPHERVLDCLPTYLLGGTSSGDFPRLVFYWVSDGVLFSSSFFLGSFVFIDLPFWRWWLWLFCEMLGLCVYM